MDNETAHLNVSTQTIFHSVRLIFKTQLNVLSHNSITRQSNIKQKYFWCVLFDQTTKIKWPPVLFNSLTKTAKASRGRNVNWLLRSKRRINKNGCSHGHRYYKSNSIYYVWPTARWLTISVIVVGFHQVRYGIIYMDVTSSFCWNSPYQFRLKTQCFFFSLPQVRTAGGRMTFDTFHIKYFKEQRHPPSCKFPPISVTRLVWVYYSWRISNSQSDKFIHNTHSVQFISKKCNKVIAIAI